MGDRYDGFDFRKAQFFVLSFVATVLAGAVLKTTAPVLVPFVISVLLSFIMEPVVDALERLRIPRGVAIFLVILLIGAGLYVIGYILFSSGRTILTLYPKYESRFSEIYAWLAPVFQLPYDEHLTFLQNIWSQFNIRESVRSFALSTSQAFLVFLQNAVMVVLFIVFLLLESAHFTQKIGIAFENKLSTRIRRVSADTIVQVSRYLSVKFYVSLATGVLVTAGLWVVGIDFPILWGVISFILNFIPNIGSIAAGAGVGIFALVQFWPDPLPIAGAIAVMLAVNMGIGNVLEPRIQGENLGLSPFVIVLSLLAWGWLWGFAGLVLAVPMTVILKIVCENVPVLEPVAILIGPYREAKVRKDPDEPATGPARDGTGVPGGRSHPDPKA